MITNSIGDNQLLKLHQCEEKNSTSNNLNTMNRKCIKTMPHCLIGICWIIGQCRAETPRWDGISADHQWRILDQKTRTRQISDVRLRLTGWLDTVRAAFSWSRAVGIFILQLTHNTTARYRFLPHFAARNCLIEVGCLKPVQVITLQQW